MQKVKIQTMLGDIIVRLYDETPIHRDNFLKLVKEGYYDGTLFHRVIKDFMIQGGDPDSKGAPAGKMLGVGGPDYTLEAEIKDGLFHKRGALAAARLIHKGREDDVAATVPFKWSVKLIVHPTHRSRGGRTHRGTIDLCQSRGVDHVASR